MKLHHIFGMSTLPPHYQHSYLHLVFYQVQSLTQGFTSALIQILDLSFFYMKVMVAFQSVLTQVQILCFLKFSICKYSICTIWWGRGLKLFFYGTAGEGSLLPEEYKFRSYYVFFFFFYYFSKVTICSIPSYATYYRYLQTFALSFCKFPALMFCYMVELAISLLGMLQPFLCMQRLHPPQSSKKKVGRYML